MKQIFNHLLVRIISLASERLFLLSEIKLTIQRWARADKNTLQQRVQQASLLVEQLFVNKDIVHKIIEALEDSRPIALTAEQEDFITLARKLFRWSMIEYKTIIEYAVEIGFDKQVLDDLQNEASKLGD